MELGIILFFAGIVIGMFIEAFRTPASLIGTLMVIKSNEGENPYLFVELDKPLEHFKLKRYVIMRVSQK